MSKITQEMIDELFGRLGLESEEQRKKLLQFAIPEKTTLDQLKLTFIRINNTSEFPGENDNAKLEHDSQ